MSERDDDLMAGRGAAPTTQDEQALIRQRQQSRARIMGILLGAFVILVFAISIVKMKIGHSG